MSEKVLVIPETSGGFSNLKFKNGFHNIKNLQDSWPDILSEAKFIEREVAEKSPEFKQIIPYCIVLNSNKFSGKSDIFTYQRTKLAGEKRLHGMYSLGVGGHINEIDVESNDSDVNTDWQKTYEKALVREIVEELGNKLYKIQICMDPYGYIYDDTTEVGKVHLGLIHHVWLTEKSVIDSKDLSISGGRFSENTWIRENSGLFENWSKIVIENMI